MEPMTAPTVNVVAATGTTGSAVCRQLRKLGWNVRATVRNPGSVAAQALSAIGVDLNAGDWDDDDPIAVGLQGCDVLYLALVLDIRNFDNERLWAQKFLRLAKMAGVRSVVYISSVSADAPEKRSLIAPDHALIRALFVKNAIEGLVSRAGFAHWTIIRPGFFMSNLLDPKARIYHELFERDLWLTAMTPDTKLNLIDPENIADFAVAAMKEPARFHQCGVDLVGQRLTPGEVMNCLSAAVGRELKAAFYTDEEIARDMSQNPLIGAQFYLRDGEKYVDAEKCKVWGIRLGTFEEFLAREHDAVHETYN